MLQTSHKHGLKILAKTLGQTGNLIYWFTRSLQHCIRTQSSILSYVEDSELWTYVQTNYIKAKTMATLFTWLKWRYSSECIMQTSSRRPWSTTMNSGYWTSTTPPEMCTGLQMSKSLLRKRHCCPDTPTVSSHVTSVNTAPVIFWNYTKMEIYFHLGSKWNSPIGWILANYRQ